MRKKLLLSLWVVWILWLGGFALVNAQAAGSAGGSNVDNSSFNDAVNAWFEGSTSIDSAVNVIGHTNDQWGRLIDVIKKFINRILGILSMIVLVIVLYGGFQMVTASGNEEKYKKGFTILKHAGIWLVVIWLAWFVVTIVFWLLRNTTANT